jgi:glycosyltransferase involved in cell wall biosynthesis
MSATPLVSVVTPVYNDEALLGECIESVRRQTFQDWEHVIVDNCSKDGSAALAERHAAVDRRIRVVRADEFVNVHQNHNRGARLIDAGARYCKFVSADDWLYPECLERMVGLAERHPEVGVVSSFGLEGDHVQHDGLLPYTQEVMSGREVIRRALLGPPWVTGTPTSLLYRADLVRRPEGFLDDSVWHSDTDVAYRCLLRADLGFVHQVLTFTRLRPGALTGFSHRVNSYASHAGRMLIRYGLQVMESAEYRQAVRAWLGVYRWYLAKQLLKPSRWRDEEFRAFHRTQIGRMLAEAPLDAALRRGLHTCLLLVGGSPGTRAAGVREEEHGDPSLHARQARTGQPPA